MHEDGASLTRVLFAHALLMHGCVSSKNKTYYMSMEESKKLKKAKVVPGLRDCTWILPKMVY